MDLLRRVVPAWIGVCLAASLSAGCVLARPALEVLSHRLSSAVVKNAANEDDWAYVLTVQVRNTGQAGRVRAKARITTPQGQFYREQTLVLAADEVSTLTFVFTEPDFLADVLAPESRSRYEFSYDVLH